MRAGNPATRRAKTLSLLFLLLFALAAGFSAYRKDLTRGFDELAHLSYVAALQEGPPWPNLENLQMLDPETLYFTQTPNYLNHPAPYYLLLARLGPKIEGHSAAPFVHRLLNIAIVLAGLAAAIAAAFRLNLDPPEIYAYTVSLVAIPFLIPLAGAVNNDNLAFAGGAFTLLAAAAFLKSRSGKWLYAALAGVVVASFAKLTGLLLMGGFVGCLLLYLVLRREFRPNWLVPILCATFLAAAPYVVFLLEYGSPAPDTQAQMELLQTGAQTVGWNANPRLGLVGYAVQFVLEFFTQWMPALAPRSRFQYAMLLLPVATVLLAFAGFCVSWLRFRQRRERPLDVMVIAGCLAIAVTFTIHVVFSYKRHLMTGWMLDAYPRYYLPLAAIIPLAALSLLPSVSPWWRNCLIAFLLAAPIVFRLLGAPIAP
jgi:hypothetical protein